MSEMVISSEQLMALSYLEAVVTNDEEAKQLIADSMSSEELITSLSEVSLILAASLIPCYTGDDMSPSSSGMVEEISSVLKIVRESFLDHN